MTHNSKRPSEKAVTCTACGWNGKRSDLAIRRGKPCPKCGLRTITVRKDIAPNDTEGFAVVDTEES